MIFRLQFRVWGQIFGNDPWAGMDAFDVHHHRPVPSLIDDPSNVDTEPDVISKKRKTFDDVDMPRYASVVINKPDHTWEEERESLLQSALKRWVVTLRNFAPWTIIRSQLAECINDIQQLRLVADCVRGRSPATLLKRVRSIEKVCLYLDDRTFPPNEQQTYQFFCAERDAGAPASRLKSRFEALVFCYHVFTVTELGDVINSRRCHGVTMNDVPSQISQASALQVAELRKLHDVLEHGEPWDQVFAGAALFAVYARSRWADLMHCCEIIVDRDKTTMYVSWKDTPWFIKL